ncbi:hypothetical protein SRHO_G00320130 [Serrasalmus rhombeus]
MGAYIGGCLSLSSAKIRDFVIGGKVYRAGECGRIGMCVQGLSEVCRPESPSQAFLDRIRELRLPSVLTSPCNEEAPDWTDHSMPLRPEGRHCNAEPAPPSRICGRTGSPAAAHISTGFTFILDRDGRRPCWQGSFIRITQPSEWDRRGLLKSVSSSPAEDAAERRAAIIRLVYRGTHWYCGKPPRTAGRVSGASLGTRLSRFSTSDGSRKA